MRTIAIGNAAGSAGKTTSAVTLAALVAQTGQRVLLIDADAQGTATHWCGITVGEGQATIADLLLGTATIGDVIVSTAVEGLLLVPAAADLEPTMVEIERKRGAELRLRKALDGYTQADVVIIDCPGAVSTLTVSALVVADAAITVTQPTVKEIQGISRYADTVTDVADLYQRTGLERRAIIPCIVPPKTAGQLYSDGLQLLTDTWPDLVTPTIRRTVRVPESHAHGTPLPVWDPNGDVTGDYRSVLAWLTERGVL